MATIPEIQSEIIDDFSFLGNWEEKYQYLIEIGLQMPPLPEAYRTEENIVHGCQSTVWLHRECRDGKVFLQSDSDALIVKGLAALLMKVYSDQPAEAILQTELTVFEKTGLNKHLSSQRTNGLMAMIEQIKAFAGSCTSGEAE